MNLYEIKNIDTGQAIAPMMTAREAAKLLKCHQSSISGAYHGNYILHGKYKVEAVDVTIPKRDNIWISWDLRRSWLLRMCGR